MAFSSLLYLTPQGNALLARGIALPHLPVDCAVAFLLCGVALLLLQWPKGRRLGLSLVAAAWTFSVARLVQLGLFSDSAMNLWLLAHAGGPPPVRLPMIVLAMSVFWLWTSGLLVSQVQMQSVLYPARRQIVGLAWCTYLVMVLLASVAYLAQGLRPALSNIFAPDFGWMLAGYVAMAWALRVLGHWKLRIHWRKPTLRSWAQVALALQLALTLLGWAALTYRESEQLVHKLESQARWLQRIFLEVTNDHTGSLERMASRWEASGGTPLSLWSLDAKAHLESDSDFQALAYFDKTGRLARFVPRADNALVKDFDLRADTFPRPDAARSPVFTEQVSLEVAAKNFLLIRALTVQGHFDGWLALVFRTEDFFSALSKPVDDFSYCLEVLDTGKVVYRNNLSPSEADARYAHVFAIPNGNGIWVIRLTPSQAAVDSLRSESALVLLIGGCLTTLMMAMAFWFFERDATSRNALLKAHHSLDELGREAHKLALVALHSRNPTVITDAAGRIEWVNQAFSDRVGISRANAPGMDYLEVLKARVADPADAVPIVNAFQSGTGVVADRLLHQSNGVDVWVQAEVSPIRDSAGQLTQFFVITRDVTEIKRVQNELDSSRRLLRSLVDVIPDMVGYWSRNLRCGFANARYLEWFGRTPEEMQGITMQELFGEELFRKNWPYVHGALRGERQDFERTLVKADGSTGYTWAHYLPDIQNGEVRGFFVAVNDITNVKLAQLQLQKLNVELKQRTQEAETASRAKSEFLSSMSHELRTPMNAMLGFAQLIAMDAQLAPHHRENVSEVLRAGKHLLSLINDLLSLSKIEAGHTELQRTSLEAAELVDECLALVRPMTVDNDTRLVSDVAPLVFTSDRRLLKQVLINLLSNAIKYNRPQGQVRVSVQPSAAGVHFVVSDTGFGIARHRQSELFQSFNRLGAETSDIEGHGIGLVVCQRLVQVLGGTIHAVSEEGVGSSFSVTLPMQWPGATSWSVATADTPSGFQFAPAVVLSIEDSPANRRLVKGIFAEYESLELIEATSGEAGLEVARMRRPDLILLDIQLPGIDGLQVLRRLRANPETRHIPVIAISAHIKHENAGRLEEAGFDAHISKPFEVHELMATVSRLLRQDRTVSEG